MSGAKSYKLSVQLEGHTADVRSVSAAHLSDSSDTLLLSASRDGTARVWARPTASKSKRELSCRYVLEGHEGFVNSSAWFRQNGAVLAITGGQDKMINAYDISSKHHSSSSTSLVPDYMLIGHEDNVCALDVFQGASSYIVSGSWDRTARVWKDWDCKATLVGHTQAVWSVLALTEDLVLTASADKLVRLYSIKGVADPKLETQPIAVFDGHTDAVRGLVRISDESFASCSNDGNINLYPIPSSSTQTKGSIKPIQTLSGHTSFVYSLSLLTDGSLASSGEDRSVRIWKDASLQQTITIPAISVWSVAALANGDLASASSDGTVRVFTKVQQRIADADVLEVYDTTVSSQALNKTQVGDVQKENLPGSEELSEPGKEGQVKMIRSGELVEAYQYSSASSKWEKIGEVVGGVGSGQKKLFQGKEYDYVFDVDIADGVPPLKLPYNSTENTFSAAHRFLEKNDLPLTYLDQVAAFIEKNTEAVNLGASNDFVDPYTGTSSYRPGAAAAQPSSANGTAGSQASKPETRSDLPPSATGILPQRVPLTFKQFNAQGAKTKIAELNSQLTAPTSMTADELAFIDQLLPKLAAISTTTSAATSSIQVQVLEDVLLRWPLSHRYPLLDIYRLACSSKVDSSSDPLQLALQASQWSQPPGSTPEDAKTEGTLSLLALRAVANVLSTEMTVSISQIVSQLQHAEKIAVLSKAARVAYSTVLYNLTTGVIAGKLTESADTQSILTLIHMLLESEKAPSRLDGEVIYRSLVALGNLLVGPTSGSLPVGLMAAVKQSAEACASQCRESRSKDIMLEIQNASALL